MLVLTMHMGVQVYASARETVELIVGAHAGDLESYVHQSATREQGKHTVFQLFNRGSAIKG